MQNYLPLLFILACPLMMFFMMRGTGGGQDLGAGDQQPRPNEPAAYDRDAARADQCIADLERQVADLQDGRDHAEGSASRP